MSKTATLLWAIAAVGLLLFSLVVWSIPPNEYQAIGIQGAMDCDGPLSVLAFGVPVLSSCSVALFLFPRKAWFNGVLGFVVPFALIASGVVSAMGIAGAIEEQQSVAHQESCRTG